MLYLIIIFTVLFFFLAWRRLDLAVMLLIAALPAYLIRFNILGLPATLLEAMIWLVFIVWAIKNFNLVKNNFLENFKKENNKKIKIHYPFDWEIALMLFLTLTAAGLAGFSPASLGIWKAYFFEPALFFIVVLNIIKNPPRPPLLKGVELILWPLAIGALAVSALAIFQKITGQLIDNPLWAAAETRRVVSFFGYPNAVGLYLGPVVLVMAGWLTSVIARSGPICHCGLDPQSRNLFVALKSGFRLGGRNDGSKTVARNDITVIIFISLIIILSVLSIYFAKSKGALIGVAAGLIVFGLMVNKKIRWTLAALIIIMASGVVFYQPARHEALKYLALNDFSGQVRRAQWRETFAMLKDGRILSGAGLANYQKAIADYHAPGIFIKDFDDQKAQRKLVFNPAYRAAHWQPLEIYLYPHNIFLNFWSELGLVGLLLFIWVVGKFLVIGIWNLFGNWKSARTNVRPLGPVRPGSDGLEIGNLATRKNKYLILGLLGAMTVIVIHGLVDVPYFKNDLAVMFWLLVAMMSLINLENRSSLP